MAKFFGFHGRRVDIHKLKVSSLALISILQVQSSFVAITVHTEKTETGNVQAFFCPTPSYTAVRIGHFFLSPDIKYRCEKGTAKVIEHFVLAAQTNIAIHMYTCTAHSQK
jgi:hypothetical protein